MRVLLIDLAKSFGGAEIRALSQAIALQGRVEACGVAVLEGSELQRRVMARGIPCHAVSIGRGSPQMLPALAQIIRQNGYTVVDAHNVHSILWGHWAAWRVGAPGRVATIHSDYKREYPGLKGQAYEASLWLTRRVSRHYIAVTEALHTKYQTQIACTRIYNAVEVPTQAPSPSRQTLFFGPDDFIVAIIGRLVPVKGHRYLIEALTSLADQPQIKLVIVGDGPLRSELESQVQAAGLSNQVHFTGFRDDIQAILGAVDAVCMASLSEAMPFVILEAAAQARPLIATQVGGLAQLLQHQHTALMVAPQEPHALADSIRQLAQQPDLAARLGQQAYQMVKESYSTTTMIEQVLAVYEQTR